MAGQPLIKDYSFIEFKSPYPPYRHQITFFLLKTLKIFSKEQVLGQSNFSLPSSELQPDLFTPLVKSKCHCTAATDVFWD